MALHSARWLVCGMGPVPDQHWSYRVISCQGLAWYPYWRRVQWLWYKFRCCKLENLNRFVINPISWSWYYFWQLMYYKCLWLYLCIRWLIETLPDRPRDYTVWSTLEPLKKDLRTWAGVIHVGSVTAETAGARHMAGEGGGGGAEKKQRSWGLEVDEEDLFANSWKCRDSTIKTR
jgi:hypothetical protein